MKIHTLPKDPGRQQKPKRVGRGEGSGHGKTSGYGHKGSQARSGRGKGYGSPYEGGQMPLTRRLPKGGFTNPFRTEYEVVNVSTLEKFFEAGAKITPETLRDRRVVRSRAKIKLLGNGEIKKALHVTVDAFSASALEKITNAGGSCQQVQAAKSEK